MTEKNEKLMDDMEEIIEHAKKDIELTDRNAKMLAVKFDLSAKQLIDLQGLDINEQEAAAKQMNQENIEAEKRKSSSGSSMAKQVNNREQKANQAGNLWGTQMNKGIWG